MTTITTPAHPNTFGFETGVVPPEFAGTTPNGSSVVDVSTLGALATGTSSPRAMALPIGSGDGTGIISMNFIVNGTPPSPSFKIATDAAATATVLLPVGSPVNVGAGSAWQTVTWTDLSGGRSGAQVDFNGVVPGSLGHVYITDLAVDVSPGNYIEIAATTGDDGGLTSGGGGGTTTVTYVAGDLVRYQGDLWMALVDTDNTVPLVDGATWAQLSTHGSSSGGSYVDPQHQFDFATAASQWTMDHAFGRIPSVTTYDETGAMLLGEIAATTSQVIVTWANPTAGSAVLS